MNKSTSDLYKNLESELRNLHQEDANLVQIHQLSVEVCLKFLSILKEQYIPIKFESVEDEILFFKTDKPKFLSLLIFHSNAYNIQINKPTADVFAQVRYFEGQCERLEQYFSENKELVKYYHSASTFLDKEMFVRYQKNLTHFIEPFVFQFDENFNTTHDYKLSTIIAYEKLAEYLANQISILKTPPALTGSGINPNSKPLNWTSSKVSLVELIYALHSAGCINYGKSEISELAGFFEAQFGIDLGDYYRKYLEIKDRKTSPTKFIDTLKDSLLRRMDEELK